MYLIYNLIPNILSTYRLLCDYTLTYWDSKQKLDPYTALSKCQEYVVVPTLRYPKTFLINFCAKYADAEIVPPAEQKRLEEKRKADLAEMKERKRKLAEEEKQRLEAKRLSQEETASLSGFSGMGDDAASVLTK